MFHHIHGHLSAGGLMGLLIVGVILASLTRAPSREPRRPCGYGRRRVGDL